MLFTAMRNRLNEREEGFTLIELLVVVIIIGILAAIAIPTFLNQRQRGYVAALTSDARNAAIEVESAYTNTNGYPAPDADLTTNAGSDPIVVEGSTDDTVLNYSVITQSGVEAGFCIVGTRDDLEGNVIYDSLAGGVAEYDGTTQTCTASTL